MSGRGLFSDLFAPAPVPAAVEITPQRVYAATMAGRTRTVTTYASETLAPGLVTPALNAPNIHDHAALAAALKATVDRLSPRPRRIALVLPDTTAKVSLLKFEKVPQRLQDLDQLIRWQMRKAVPFRIEEAQASWSDCGPAAGGGQEYLVVLARRDIVESYERVCAMAGLHAGLVDLASLNLVNAALMTQAGQAPGDWLLIHVADAYATIAIVRGGRIIFFRNRQAEGSGAADLSDLVHQTAMYHEDRLGGGAFARAVLVGSGLQDPAAAQQIRRQVEERLGLKVDRIDVRSLAAFRDGGNAAIDHLAPALGVLVRDAVVRGRGGAERAAS